MAQEFAERLKKIEQKWQKKWEEENIFEADPNNDEKFFITVAYPYPSGGMHLGHARTFTLPDVFARFQRMKGKNVLFPMAWHVTGSTINGALKRLHEGEEKQLDTLKNTFNVSQEDLDSMEEPMDYANYFIENSYRPSMEKLGFSVDWRREFNTNEEQYNKFIEWQYQRLNEKGLISKGKHPTRYCLNEKNSVNDHGLLEGEDSEKQEYTLVKFKQDSRVFPMATLRPETVFGVTHALINPEQDYVVAEVDGEDWVISEEAAEKINQQNREVEIIQESKGEEFVGEEVTNPVTGDEVLLLPATFVDPDQSTGVVMSVPAHAPYDWISLEDLKQDEELVKEYGLDPKEVKSIEPVSIINLEGYGDFPAKEACEEYGVRSQEDEALEKATEEVYEEELHHGKMNANCQDFTGEDVKSARDKIKNQFTNMGRFDSMWELSDETICRCGGKVVVSKQETWFVDYSQEDWKEKARELLDEIEIIPEKSRSQFEHIIEWLEERPLIRNYGLGTKLPFDDDFIIEPLADSTIYMSFYTIRHIIEDVDAEKLEPAFFDYVFREEGNIEEVAKDTGIDEKVIKDARKSFDYWYPLDWRTSGNELIDNHLTFFMFHHTALFEEEYWPNGIATWGMGLLEGEKMSSSKGHVKLTQDAVDRWGADTTRFFLFASVEPWQDFNWRKDEVEKYQNKLRAFYDRSLELYGSGVERERNDLDRYVLSRLQEIKENATEGLEDFQTRKAGMNGFFQLNSLINRYRKRSEELNTGVINEVIEAQIRLMAPFTPHICEELWSEIGKDGLVAQAEWPTPDGELRKPEVEKAQEVADSTVDDIRELSEIVGEFDTVKVVVADDWKREVFRELSELVDERPEFGEAMGRLVDGREQHSETIKDYLQDYLNNPGELPPAVFETDREVDILEQNRSFLEEEFDAEVEIEKEADSEEDKAERAEPGRPAIVMYSAS